MKLTLAAAVALSFVAGTAHAETPAKWLVPMDTSPQSPAVTLAHQLMDKSIEPTAQPLGDALTAGFVEDGGRTLLFVFNQDPNSCGSAGCDMHVFTVLGTSWAEVGQFTSAGEVSTGGSYGGYPLIGVWGETLCFNGQHFKVYETNNEVCTNGDP
jgi:hypothetical protein